MKAVKIGFLAMVLGLVGCQKPNDTQTTDVATPTSDTTLSTDKQALEELVIALDWVPNTNHTGLYVAKELGYFENQGFDAKIVQPSEDSTSTLVANERADLGVYFRPNMVKRLVKGEPITAVAAIAQNLSLIHI